MAKQALVGEGVIRTNGFKVPPENLVIVGLDKYDASHPLYDRRAIEPLNEGFIISVMGHLIEPVVVTKYGDEVLVVAGRRRVLAVREGNRRRVDAGAEPVGIDCKVVYGDMRVLAEIMIDENSHRKADSPMDSARKLAAYLNLELLGATELSAQQHFAVTGATIAKWLRLLQLEPEVQRAIDDGKLSANAADKRCYGKTREQQLRVLEKPKERQGRPKRPPLSVLKAMIESPERKKWLPGFVEGLKVAAGLIPREQYAIVVKEKRSKKEAK